MCTEAALEDGRLNTTQLGVLAPVLTAENVQDVVHRAAHLTKERTKELAVSIRPKEVPADGLRRLPTLVHRPATGPERLGPDAPRGPSLEMGIRFPDGDLEKVFDRMLDDALEKHGKRLGFVAPTRPRKLAPPRPPTPGERAPVLIAVRREVLERDGYTYAAGSRRSGVRGRRGGSRGPRTAMARSASRWLRGEPASPTTGLHEVAAGP